MHGGISNSPNEPEQRLIPLSKLTGFTVPLVFLPTWAWEVVLGQIPVHLYACLAHEDELCSLSSPALLPALPLSLTLLSAVQRASPKYVITKGGGVSGGELEPPDFVFIANGCKKLTFRMCLWNWTSEIVCFRNNSHKIYICVCVFISLWMWIQLQIQMLMYIEA